MAGVRVTITIEGDSKDDDSRITAWFKSLDSDEFKLWVEKVKTLQRAGDEQKKKIGIV